MKLILCARERHPQIVVEGNKTGFSERLPPLRLNGGKELPPRKRTR